MRTKRYRWMLLITMISFIMGLSGCETMHTRIVIPAEPEAVWSVLMDTEKYHEWNPVFIKAEGDIVEGATLNYQFIDPNNPEAEPVDMETEVVRVVRPSLLKQKAGTLGILTADHEYRLQTVEGGTEVIQHEEDRGIALLFWDASWVEPAYQKALEALKKRVISIQQIKAQ